MRYIFHDSFYKTIDDLYSKEKKLSFEQAQKFKNGLKRQIQRIKNRPYSYPKINLNGLDKIFEDYRMAYYMKKYIILFQTVPEELHFLGILYMSENDIRLFKF